MNDEEIPIEEDPKPKRVRLPKVELPTVYEDPYAEDFVWKLDVAPSEEPREPAAELDPYAEPESENNVGEITPDYFPDEPFEGFPTQVIDRSSFEPELEQPFTPEPFPTESADETVRRSGLAYSIGIVFVVSVAFMLLLGWIADWMFGTKPWGLVGGIVLGSIIGFVQVVRISSRIFSPDKNAAAISPLMSHATKDDPSENGEDL